MQREKIQQKVVSNRDRIRGQLKMKIFNPSKKQFQEPDNDPNTPQMNQQEENHSPQKGQNIHSEEGQLFENLYDEGEELGQGAHAIVKKCYNKGTNKSSQVYAVKIFRTSEPEIISTIRKTYQIGKLLHHKFIVQVKELFINEKSGKSHLVMEYVPLPSLETLLPHFIGNEKLTADLIRHILTAVNHIHKHGICHRDLKPENILVGLEHIDHKTSIKRVVIIDLGVSKQFQICVPGSRTPKEVDMWTSTGTQIYCAPEIFMGIGYTKKIDIWAVGVITYQCLVGKLPFHKETVMDTIDAIATAQLSDPKFEQLSSSAKNFILSLLHKDASKRLSARRALKDIWMQEPKNKSQDDSFLVTSNTSHIEPDLTQSSNPQRCKQEIQNSSDFFAFNSQEQDIHTIKVQMREFSRTLQQMKPDQ